MQSFVSPEKFKAFAFFTAATLLVQHQKQACAAESLNLYSSQLSCCRMYGVK